MTGQKAEYVQVRESLSVFRILNFNNNLDGRNSKSFNYQLMKNKNSKWFHFFLTLKDKRLEIEMHWAVCLKRMCFSVTAFSLLLMFLCLPAVSALTATLVPVRWWNRIQAMSKGRFIQHLFKHTYLYSPDSQQ